MALVEMVMPKMGESIMEGTILNWLKKPGDRIEQDESVLEVATDKVDTEVPATHSGILKEILAQKGEVIGVGKPIAIIETEAVVTSAPAATTSAPVQESTPAKTQIETVVPFVPAATVVETTPVAKQEGARFYSPLVLNIARQENISMTDLETIPGTGKDNRVTKQDILNYVEKRKQQPAATTQNGSAQPKVEKAPSTGNAPTEDRVIGKVSELDDVYIRKPIIDKAAIYSGEYEVIEMDRMRKIIAERMVDSRRIAPHVTSFVEADVTNIVYWRNRMKHEFMDREGAALTFTPIFIEAVVRALRDFPLVNACVDGDKIIVKKDINIGMAVALPSGNLVVPVIRHADQLNIIGLTKKVNDLARRARAGKLTPDDLSGGTYSISNVGSFGNMMGTPIIVQPQVGILALGAVIKKPAVIETPHGDTLGIRHKMFLSHSYDHRIVDGSLGGMFVRKVADYLEGFDVNRKVFH
jgi:2-oxoglutarate dehydrogenase E2 component (dihydrolipoamide succinyltransferase)